MTKEQLATKLDGREYGDEIMPSEEDAAKANGLVVIFGYSDDCTELRGAICDEVSCYGGKELRLHSEGAMDEHEDSCLCGYCGYCKAEEQCVTVYARWDCDGYAWKYEADLPHAAFEIVEDRHTKYCRGIVIDVASLPVLNLARK